MTVRKLFETAAAAGGAKPPRVGIPLWAVYLAGYAGDAVGRILNRDTPVTSTSARLLHILPPMDHGKAVERNSQHSYFTQLADQYHATRVTPM